MNAQHFFEANGLRTQLDIVVVPPFASATFVFNGKGNRGPAIGRRMKLNNIGNADNSKSMADEPQATGRAKLGLVRVTRLMSPLMRQRPRRRVNVIGPDPLNAMNKTPAFAEEEIVQGRQGRVGVGVGIGHQRNRHHGITPQDDGG